MASSERKFIANKNCQHKKSSCLVMCIGAAGTGVGSRIKGHLKMGGKQLRRRHRRYGVVAITNEYKSSQTCATCFQQVCRPKGKIGSKVKSVNGSSVCFNYHCLSYRKGHNTKNRDVEASKCIALAGVSLLLAQPMSPFSVTSSQSETALSSYREPRVTSALSVPSNMGLP